MHVPYGAWRRSRLACYPCPGCGRCFMFCSSSTRATSLSGHTRFLVSGIPSRTCPGRISLERARSVVSKDAGVSRGACASTLLGGRSACEQPIVLWTRRTLGNTQDQAHSLPRACPSLETGFPGRTRCLGVLGSSLSHRARPVSS